MQQFIYRVPRKGVRVKTEMPIINELGESVFILQKQKHRFFANLIHHSIRFGLPYCYKISNTHGQLLFRINCAFPGIRYILTEHLFAQTLPITKHRVQLIEKAYSFTISNIKYFFEKDYTGGGHLKCDNKEVAVVTMPFDSNVNREFDKIIVNALTQEIAPLAVVLFHTFFYYGA